MLKQKCPKINIKRAIKNAPEAKVFWTADGRKLYNLHDLVQALEKMEERIFKAHVNAKKNDFTLWIKLVLDDKKLARTLRWTTTLGTTVKKIREHIERHYI